MPIIKLISVNVNFPDTVPNGVLSFRQIKIRPNFFKCDLEAFRRIKFPSTFLLFLSLYNNKHLPCIKCHHIIIKLVQNKRLWHFLQLLSIETCLGLWPT